jgi:uncharacterized protein
MSKPVESLVAEGVRFDLRLHTVDTFEHKTGKLPDIIPAVPRSRSASALSLTQNGYTSVRP